MFWTFEGRTITVIAVGTSADLGFPHPWRNYTRPFVITGCYLSLGPISSKLSGKSRRERRDSEELGALSRKLWCCDPANGDTGWLHRSPEKRLKGDDQVLVLNRKGERSSKLSSRPGDVTPRT